MKLKKILAKILCFILALVLLLCALIVLSAIKPDSVQPLRDFASDFAEKKKLAAAEASSAEGALADESLAEATTDAASFEFSFIFLNDEEEEEQPQEKYLTFKEYEKKRDLDDVLDENIIDVYDTRNQDDPYRKLVDEGADEALFDDDYFRQFDGKSDYVVTQPEVYDITDADEAQQIVDNTGVGELGEDAEFDALFYPYYHMLQDKGKSLYKQIYANCNALNSEFKPVYECSPKEWQSTFECVFYDHPELFWMSNQSYAEYDYSGKVIKIVLKFYSELSDVASAKSRFDADAQEILAGAQDLSTDYEKEKYIHDALVDKLIYQHNSLDQSSYSSIAQDHTVCCGYAKAFQYLMQQLGVPTYFCVGWGGGMHGWNIIKLDDGYYNVDCTWDDMNPTIYDYFNVSDRNNLMHTRMYQSRYLPPCNGGKYSGLEKKEVDLSPYNLASDKVFSDMDEYIGAVLEAAAGDILSGKNESNFKLAISQDIFMDWYLANFEGKYSGESFNSQDYNGDLFDLTLSFEHLDSGDYLIDHHVNLK